MLVERVKDFFEVDEEIATREIEQAKLDFERFKDFLASAKENKLSLLEMAQVLGGHNYAENDLFDVNFGNNLLITVHADYTISEDLEFYIDYVSCYPMEICVRELDDKYARR